MKAVFLDRNTFSPTIELPAPAGVTDWQVFEATANDTTTVVARLQGAQIAITNKVLMTREIPHSCPICASSRSPRQASTTSTQKPARRMASNSATLPVIQPRPSPNIPLP